MKNINQKIKSVYFLFSIFLIVFSVAFIALNKRTVQAQSGVSSDLIGDSKKESNKKFDNTDIPKIIKYETSRKATNLAPLQSLSTSLSPTTNQGYVQPILFVPSDLNESAGNTSAINSTLQMIKRWYSGAIENNNSTYVYKINDTIVYRAPQNFSYYKCPNNATSCDNYDGLWVNIQTQLMAAGYPLWTAGTDYVVFVKGAGGWAGSSFSSASGISNFPAPGPASQTGVAILGDWALDAITGTVNSECFANIATACYLDPQRGAIGHELGHTFGLAHAQNQNGSIMYSWWNFPFISLFETQGNNEKSTLTNNPTFFAPQACTKDVQINQVNVPSTVKTRSIFNVSFNVTNYGYCRWSATNTDLRIFNADVWKTNTKRLDKDLYPAQSYTFSLSLTAPAIRTANTNYNNFWKMRSSNQFFGAQMGKITTVIR